MKKMSKKEKKYYNQKARELLEAIINEYGIKYSFICDYMNISKSTDVLKNELVKYKGRNKDIDSSKVYGVVKVINNIYPFSQGDYALVIGGERYDQRNRYRLKEGLGIDNIDEIVFIDDCDYCFIAEEKGIGLGDLLDFHFESLDEDDYKELEIIDPYN